MPHLLPRHAVCTGTWSGHLGWWAGQIPGWSAEGLPLCLTGAVRQTVVVCARFGGGLHTLQSGPPWKQCVITETPHPTPKGPAPAPSDPVCKSACLP